MSIQFFSFRTSDENRLYLPSNYRKTVAWLPQIGDIFPDFSATTTHGDLRFFDWAEGQWTYIFSHPAAKTPVCTSELIALSTAEMDFAARGVKPLGLSGSSLDDQILWHAEIERLFDITVTCPFVSDPKCRMATNFGMLHRNSSTSLPIRKSFIIDPQMRVRMIFEYPIGMGRNTDEILRVIDGLQEQDKTGLAIPADWLPGDDLLFPENLPEEDARETWGSRFVRLNDYLAIVRDESDIALEQTPPLRLVK